MKHKKWIVAILLFFMLVGLGILVSSLAESWRLEQSLDQAVASFKERGQSILPTVPDGAKATETELVLPELRAAMEEYNKKIYLDGQAELVDSASYEAEIFDLSQYGIDDEIVGVITIPKIDLEMSLYLGATSAHLELGFAQLSQTSAPIGGENTNCVVAGHRGWRNADYFYHADKLEIGDLVFLENYWEVLTYQVVEIKTVTPDDRESALIQPGRDLLTLLTCTPYRVNSHRLLVICERVENSEGGNNND